MVAEDTSTSASIFKLSDGMGTPVGAHDRTSLYDVQPDGRAGGMMGVGRATPRSTSRGDGSYVC